MRVISEVLLGILCSNESVAPQTSDTVSKLKAKHPDDNGEVFVEEELKRSLEETTIEDVIRAIRSFPLSSSGGFGGLRPRHLKDLTSFTCGESFIESDSVFGRFGKIW